MGHTQSLIFASNAGTLNLKLFLEICYLTNSRTPCSSDSIIKSNAMYLQYSAEVINNMLFVRKWAMFVRRNVAKN